MSEKKLTGWGSFKVSPEIEVNLNDGISGDESGYHFVIHLGSGINRISFLASEAMVDSMIFHMQSALHELQERNRNGKVRIHGVEGTISTV
jgi:hypothetical protein